MSETVKVDLHSHSIFSDGSWDPEKIVQQCAKKGIQYASLADHNTLAGLDQFESACEHYGIGFIDGLELTGSYGEKEIHLLCYGFDRKMDSFKLTVTSVKENYLLNKPIHSIMERRSLPELIEYAHQAGGIVILAHPFLIEPDLAKLELLITELIGKGLDGIEAYHPSSNLDQVAFLRDLASRKGCVVSAGTDHHGIEGTDMGVDLPVAEWAAFRNRLILQRKKSRLSISTSETLENKSAERGKDPGRMRLLTWMVVPALAAVLLFTIAMFGFFIPGYEKVLMDRKRETILELTSTVWSMLNEAEKKIRSGQFSPAEARAEVIERTRTLRYGREGKDYFWLQDLTPRMIMHPYRTDLEGQDLSDFKDPTGVHIFVVFADKVRKDQSGYVDYVWQWKDDPTRLEAKESYIRLFEPWGWMIGTGLYIHDVVSEIRVLKMRLVYSMLVVVITLILLLLVMLRNGLSSERMRLSAEKRLRESNDRYLSLVQAAAEGVLFVRNNRCAYANPVFLQFAGCDAHELALFNWQDFFSMITAQDPFFMDTGTEVYRDSFLRRRDGTDVPCRIALKGMAENQAGSFVILVRRSEDPKGQMDRATDGLLNRLLNLPSAAAEDIAREITEADTSDQVITLCTRVPELVRSMLESGASPIAITEMISSITDSATTRFIDLAQRQLGPEPVPFSFVALGSQGREEQTLFTDQDNAIIYDPLENGTSVKVEKYFIDLGTKVCENLAKSGYRNCKGLVMANNPQWCQPQSVWKGYFTDWITKAEEHDMMEFSVFFDLRCVKGDVRLIQSLQSHIQEEVVRAPWFLTQTAKNALFFKSPLRFLGNIVSVPGSKEKAGHLDLKKMMMPLVSFARLYCLQKKILATSTQKRLAALSDQGVLLPTQFQDALTAFETLTRIRLRHQSMTIQKGEEPDNLIDPSWLGHIDEAVLKECFKEIDRLQERISRDFFGGETSI